MQIGIFFEDEKLISYESMQDGGFFGVSCEKIEGGLIVREVISGTAAEKAGISVDDLLLAVNDEPLDTREEL